MARQVRIPITNDDEIISESPLVYADILYYELWYRVQNTANWTQVITYHPLTEYLVSASPVSYAPCIVLNNLPNGVTYEYQVRRFNSDNVPGEWVSGTFTTDQNPIS